MAPVPYCHAQLVVDDVWLQSLCSLHLPIRLCRLPDFVRGFGLATFWPIYGLTLAALLTAFPVENEITQLQAILNLEYLADIYLWDLVIAFKSALLVLPFSLFFFDRMDGYVALLKIPLCVFFLALVLAPTLFMLLFAMLATFGM